MLAHLTPIIPPMHMRVWAYRTSTHARTHHTMDLTMNTHTHVHTHNGDNTLYNTHCLV
jgi:hypothetical protein